MERKGVDLIHQGPVGRKPINDSLIKNVFKNLFLANGKEKSYVTTYRQKSLEESLFISN